MSHGSTQHRSRSNPPPAYRSQLPIPHHTTGHRKDPTLSPMVPPRAYQEVGDTVRPPAHVSYPTHVIPDSGSSDLERPEQTEKRSTLRRRPTGKRKTTIGSGPDSLSGSRHRRRGSGPEDLALLETHILPSLSKTIDRMTNGKTPMPPQAIPDTIDNTMPPLPKSLRLQSKLPTVKPPSQPSTPRPILKSSTRTPTTPTISSFTPANNSLRSVKSFSPSPRSHGYFDDLVPTLSPTSLLSERPPSYLSPQGQAPDTPTSYHSSPRTPSRRPTISQQSSPRPSYVAMDHISRNPNSPNHILDYGTEQDGVPLLSPITAERAPWDEALSEAWQLGNRLSPTPADTRQRRSPTPPPQEGFHPPERASEVRRGSLNNSGDYISNGDDAALQRKRRETLLAIVEGVNSQFDSGAPNRESSEYSGYVGLAIGSRESTFGEGMANLPQQFNTERHQQNPDVDRRSSASSTSREGCPGEERQSWCERHLSNSTPRISHDAYQTRQEPKRYPPGRGPPTPPKPKPDAQVSRRSPARGSSEQTHSAQAPTPPDHLPLHQREQKRRSVSTPPVARRSQTDPTQNGKGRESGNLLPRTRSSLFLPTISKVNLPTSGDGLEAFGLPNSLSYVFKDSTGRAGIVPAESCGSLDDRADDWKRDSDVRKASEGSLSSGAERLFRTLADENTTGTANSSSRSPHPFSQTSYETPTQARRASMPVARSDFSIASTSSAPSVYDDPVEEWEADKKRYHPEPANPQSSTSHAFQSWKSTIPPSSYHSFSRLYGEAEMQRQEVIFEICHTEALFVQRLRTVLRHFIRPLRAQDTSTWISGVPGSIARLFDWFEDIMNLHIEIDTETRHVQSNHQTVVERFAGMLRKFVPRFEVYQPYIIRVEGVLGQLMGDSGENADGNWANFREFVKIQELKEDCQGWSLQSLLLEPVRRSSKLVEMLQVGCARSTWSCSEFLVFKTLLERTSKHHIDRLPAISLVSSMRTMFRVMQEVKAREEEYNLVKGLASAIEGLASPSSLAKRDRRLLIRGSCRLLVSLSQARSQRSSNGNRQSLVLLDAINNRDGTKRSEKRRSTLPVFTSDAGPNILTDSASPGKAASRGSTSDYDLAFSPVEVLVFSDVVVVVIPAGQDRWKLVDKFGAARVLSVAESIIAVRGDIALCFRCWRPFHRSSRA